MQDELPEPLASIAALRREGLNDLDSAARLGMTRRKLWDKVHTWNQRHPQNKIPSPASRPTTPRYVLIAEMTERGLLVSEIARELGETEASVRGRQSYARQKGILAPAYPPRQDAMAEYTALRNKGAAPPLGTLGDTLRALPPEAARKLLDHSRSDDTTLALTVARLIGGLLNVSHDAR